MTLAEHEIDRGGETCFDLRRQLSGNLDVLEPTEGQSVGLLDLVRLDEGAQVLFVCSAAGGILLDPRGQILDQIRIASLLPQELSVGATQRILLVIGPLRLL